jgi:hypothetical protein
VVIGSDCIGNSLFSHTLKIPINGALVKGFDEFVGFSNNAELFNVMP